MNPLQVSLGLFFIVALARATWLLGSWFNAKLDQWAGIGGPEYDEYRAYLKTTWFGKDYLAWKQEKDETR